MPDQQVSQFLKQEKEFSFADAVAEAKRDFPKQTAGITFIDLAAEDAEKQVQDFAEKAKLTSFQYDSLMRKINSKAAVATEMNGFQILAMPSTREGDKQSFPGDDYKSAYFCFQHELGHFVVPNAQTATSRKSDEYKEHAADTFAMLRGLKEGVFQKSDLLKLADKRGQEMLMTMDFHHFTSMSLDALAINPKNIDFLSLSKQEIVKISVQHAKTFETGSDAYKKLSKFQYGNGATFTQDGELLHDVIDKKLHDLHDMAMKSPANSQAFYLAARVLNNVIETGSIKIGSVEHKVDVTADYWQEAKAALKEKAGNRDIGAKKAGETVSLTRPEKPKTILGRIADSIKPIKI